MAAETRKQILSSVQSLLSSGSYSDIDITCGPDVYHAHRAIVCTRSEFFAGAARFPGVESDAKSIDLPDEERETVKLLMQFFYEGDYLPIISDSSLTATPFQTSKPSVFTPQRVFPHTCPPHNPKPQFVFQRGCTMVLCPHHTCGTHCRTASTGFVPARAVCSNFTCSSCPAPAPPAQIVIPSPGGTQPADLLTHAKMYAIADRLIVTGLKALALAKFQSACTHYWDTPEFPAAVEYIFTSTPEEDSGLRNTICAAISKQMQLMKDEKIKALMMELHGLAYGVLYVKATQYEWLK